VIAFTTTDSANTALSVGITTATLANAANALVGSAIVTVDTQRATLGAVANRLESAVSNLMSRSENQSAARSRIEDTDFAVESANLAKNQVLQQAGTAMLAQANASGQGVLSLLK
jgi:flagellin